MIAIFFRRILVAIPVLLAVASITFFLIKIAPGGPFDADKAVSPQVLKNLNVNPKTFVLRATSSSIKDSLRKRTSEAYEKGVFGAPTFISNNKIWYKFIKSPESYFEKIITKFNKKFKKYKKNRIFCTLLLSGDKEIKNFMNRFSEFCSFLSFHEEKKSYTLGL